MTIFNDIHPRSIDGTFSNKTQGFPEIDLAYPELPAFDPNFFYDRVSVGTSLTVVDDAALTENQRALVRNASQAVNDAFALENGMYASGKAANHVEAVTYRDGDLLVVDVQHLDPSEAPYGSLIAFNLDGTLASIHDNVSDGFGERWVRNTGLRAQLLADLTEATDDGSLGVQL